MRHPGSEGGRPWPGRLAQVAGLALLWALLSGRQAPLQAALGLCSVAFVVVLAGRMRRAEGARRAGDARAGVRLRWLRVARYAPWLLGRILLANLDVARRVLRPEMRLAPLVLRVPARQRSELGRVLFANSITLTPGTVSVRLSGGEVEVHALTREAAAALEEGEMGRRVAELER